jgi:hypothetical protein
MEPEVFLKQNRQTKLPFYWTKVIEPAFKKPQPAKIPLREKGTVNFKLAK